MKYVPRSRPWRLAIVLGVLAGAIALVLWRLDINVVRHAFEFVTWRWVVVAVLLNLASIVFRSIAWEIVIDQAVAPPCPRRRDVFAAFCVGLLGNAALPGRVGEVARIVVLTRRMRGRPGLWATLTGTVFAHRLFDVVAASGARHLRRLRGEDPAVGAARAGDRARRRLRPAHRVARHRAPHEGRRRRGRRRPGPPRAAARPLRPDRAEAPAARRSPPCASSSLGWATQLLAVWTMFYAFEIDGTITMAALVLVIMNLVMVFPLWPGNVGLVQAAIAFSLLPYGVAFERGFAYGIGLQAVEVSVGVALGFIFLAREGFSFAMLRRMPEVTDLEVDERVERIA